MRIKVRSVDPPAGGEALEEIEARPASEADPPEADRAPAAAPTAAELGPAGEQILTLLERAAHLTETERRRLEEAAGWRWWSMTPLPTTTVAAARSLALLRGRRAGRAKAIVTLEAAVKQLINDDRMTLRRGSRLPACISNAGLARLLRDQIEPETFEMLAGPWLEVMHH